MKQIKQIKQIKRLQKTNSFRVSVTYDIVTPESAANGDFSESGFETAPFYTRSVSEILNLIREHYAYENFQPGQNRQSIYADSFTSDYRTGTETSYAVHVEGPEKLMRVLNKRLEKLFSRKAG